MKMKWGLVLAIVIAVLVAVVIGIRVWFISPGIRVLGHDIHVDLSQTCYIIDGQSGEILDETTVSVKGATSRSDHTLFDGKMNVIGYHNVESGTIEATMGIKTTESGCWIITKLENCTHQETDANGITKDVEHICDYSYTYYLYPNDPGALVVLIESFEKYEPMYAICADNEQAALERYENFLKQHP